MLKYKPQLSPKAKLVQTVGLFGGYYRLRKAICSRANDFWRFGPYNVLWRTGANRNTLITFSHDVVISGQPLSKGTYALYTTPNKDAWMVYFYNKTDNWGTPAQWDEEQISLAVRAEVQDVSHTESFRFQSKTLPLILQICNWLGKKQLYSSNCFSNNKIMESNLSKMNVDTASANDLYTAAVYYFNNDKDLKKQKSGSPRQLR
ncbi:MAG: hypothetical protein CM15mP32_1110 [Flavobacteriaceae bacterium]|nr:MAG: hypothetical protein CM15mP32_1110 [Flavobacteriaceae bacterium]